jgi:hypothetical protein
MTSPRAMVSRGPFRPTGNPLFANRFVGWKPLLYISDAGLTPNPSTTRPSVRAANSGWKQPTRTTQPFQTPRFSWTNCS